MEEQPEEMFRPKSNFKALNISPAIPRVQTTCRSIKVSIYHRCELVIFKFRIPHPSIDIAVAEFVIEKIINCFCTFVLYWFTSSRTRCTFNFVMWTLFCIRSFFFNVSGVSIFFFKKKINTMKNVFE